MEDTPESQGYQFRSSQDLTVNAPEAWYKRPAVKHMLYLTIHFVTFILLCVAATSVTTWTKVTDATGNTVSFNLKEVVSAKGSVDYNTYDQLAGTVNSAKTAAATQGLVIFCIILHLVHAAVYGFFYVVKQLDNIVTRLFIYGFVFIKFLFLAIAVGIFNNTAGTALDVAKKKNGATSKLSHGSNEVIATIFLELIATAMFFVQNRNK